MFPEMLFATINKIEPIGCMAKTSCYLPIDCNIIPIININSTKGRRRSARLSNNKPPQQGWRAINFAFIMEFDCFKAQGDLVQCREGFCHIE